MSCHTQDVTKPYLITVYALPSADVDTVIAEIKAIKGVQFCWTPGRGLLADIEADNAALRGKVEKAKTMLAHSGWFRCGCPHQWDKHSGCYVADALKELEKP